MKRRCCAELVFFILLLTWAHGVYPESVIDNPLVISLSRHMYRYDETYQLMEKAGFTNIQRFEAVDGPNTSSEFFEALNIFGGNCRQKGCAASHLLIWKNFIEDDSQNEYLFVCEDDMVPHSDFSRIFPVYWEATPKDFDIVMVGNLLNKHKNSKDLITILPTLSTHAYIISKKGAKLLWNLYQQISKKKKYFPRKSKFNIYIIDVFLHKMMEDRRIIYYCYNGRVYPEPQYKRGVEIRKLSSSGICFQNKKLESTIHNEI